MPQTITRGYKALLDEANAKVETIPAAEAVPLLGDGSVVFVDLRDEEGLLQVVINPENAPAAAETAHALRNEFVIRVADYGAGLDLDRIRAKAAASGLTAKGEQVSDQDAAALVFEPGFSTADALTAIKSEFSSACRSVGFSAIWTNQLVV